MVGRIVALARRLDKGPYAGVILDPLGGLHAAGDVHAPGLHLLDSRANRFWREPSRQEQADTAGDGAGQAHVCGDAGPPRLLRMVGVHQELGQSDIPG